MVQIQHIVNIGIMTINRENDDMKKLLFFLAMISMCFVFYSCNKTQTLNATTTSNSLLEMDTSQYATDEKDYFENKTTVAKQEISNTSEQGGADLLPRKYRNNYYSIPASFIKIVGKSDYEEWEDIYLSENYPDYSNEMVMVAYVKEFNISKEDFERANLNYAKFIEEHYSHICLDPQDYADQEMQEIYNTDIIYTFDNEIINEYYLGIDYPFLNEYQYDEALEAGTYETRTTDWVDIEQMEAEINAKYGVPEVTETTTAIPEETEITE